MSDENDRRLTANSLLSMKKVIWKNFVGGIFWGVGSVLGATVVVSIIVFLLRSAAFAPIVGDAVRGLIQGVEQNQVQDLKTNIGK